MKIKMDELVRVIANSLDIVETELLGAMPNHGKRIAVLAATMGRRLNLNDDELIALTTCALFHDNALTEYILSEQINSNSTINMKKHCEIGQRNVESLPFKTDISGFVLYHHEKADGSGAFGKKEGEYPLEAELIALVDMVDVKYHLGNLQVDDLPKLQKIIENEAGVKFTKRVVEAMLDIFDNEMLLSLRDDKIFQTAKDIIPSWEMNIEDFAVIRIADFIACIIDYKSTFTKRHSVEIANRVWIMCDYYKFDSATRAKAYLAASLHDIGKLQIQNSLLDKPTKLTDSEFKSIKEHAVNTYEALKDIKGLEDVSNWASNHHEKLDGTGYPFRKKAEDLDHMSRLMACLDIYQGVSEERPYHSARSHKETLVILYDMAEKGQIDLEIVKDLDIVMINHPNVSSLEIYEAVKI